MPYAAEVQGRQRRPGRGAASTLLGIFVVLWISTGLLRVLSHGLSPRLEVRDHATTLGVMDAGSQVALFLLALAVAGVIPLHRLSRAAQIGTVVACGSLLILIVGFAQSAVRARVMSGEWLGIAEVPAAVFPLLPVITWNLPHVIAQLGLGYAMWYAIHERRLRKRLAAMELQLSRARFDAFVGSMHPHLLFSILDAIRVQVRSDPEAAGRLLVRASDVLRSASRISLGMSWLLQQEMDLVELAASVERIRSGRDVAISAAIPENLLEVRVPFGSVHLLLREILLGQDGTDTPLGIDVAPTRDNNRLTLVVEAHGASPARPDALPPMPQFQGLESELRKRFGTSMDLQFERTDRGGTRVVLALPLSSDGDVEWSRGAA